MPYTDFQPKKMKKKTSSQGMQPGDMASILGCVESPLEDFLINDVDHDFLDSSNDYPIVPNLAILDPMILLDTYSTSTSMSGYSSRWLRPNKRKCQEINMSDNKRK